MFRPIMRLVLVAVALFAFGACQSAPSTDLETEGDSVPEYEREYRDRIDAARVSARTNRYTDAEATLTSVIEAIAEETRPISPTTSLAAYMFRGLVRMDRQRPGDAHRDLERALELVDEVEAPDPSRKRDLWVHLGRARGMEENHLGALAAFDTALQVNREAAFSDPFFVSRTHVFRAYAYGQMSDRISEVEAFEAAIAAYQEIEESPEQLEVLGGMYVELAQMRFRLERYAESADAALRATGHLKSAGADPARIGDAYYFCAVGLMQAGIEEGQPEAYRQAILHFDQTTHPNFEFLGVASFNLGNYHQHRGEPQIAAGYFERAVGAYGHILRVIRSQEAQYPGSVPPGVRESFESRLNDAQRRLERTRASTLSTPEASPPIAGLNLTALRGAADTPLSRFIRDVLNPTMDGVEQVVTMTNGDITLAFMPDLRYTLTDHATGRVQIGRRGFEMDMAVQKGRIYLLPVDPATMSRDEFLNDSNYKEHAPVVLRAVDSDGTFVTFEYVRPEPLVGEGLVLELVLEIVPVR